MAVPPPLPKDTCSPHVHGPAGYRPNAHVTDRVGALHRVALPRSWLKVHLELNAAIDEPPQRIVLLPAGWPRGERALTRLGGGIAPARLVGLRSGFIGLIDRTEPGAS